MNSKKHLVLILCTGNTCRSPMAECLLNASSNEYPILDKFTFQSAGVFAQDNQPASSNSQKAIEGKSLSLESHRSQQLTQELIDQAYMILGMTSSHIQQLEFQYERLPEKIFPFRYWLEGSEIDIPDPFGGNLNEYQNCLESIEESIPSIAQYLESQGLD